MKNINKILLVFLTAIALASCAVGKKYERPDLEAPERFRDVSQVTADTIVLPWKDFYTDPQLQLLIEKALAKNSEVQVAVKTIEQLDVAYKQARLGLLPTASLSAGANRGYPSKNSLNGSLNEQFAGTRYLDDYALNLNVSWEADIWGKVAMQKREARANYFLQQENFAALKTRIVVQVAQAYYNLLALDEQLKIAKESLNLTQKTIEVMELQYNSGAVSSLALGQTRAQQKTAQLLIPQAQSNIAIQENALSILCGEYPDKIQRAAKFDAATLSGDMFPTVPASLLSRRPDLKAAEYSVVAAAARSGIAKSALYPSITIDAQLGANAFKLDKWLDFPGSLTKSLAIGIAQPLFQRGALKAAHKTAQMEQEKAVIQFRQSFMTAIAEVSDALARKKFAAERLERASEKSVLLDKATRDAMLLYNSGLANYLEVITAQSSLLENQLETINIKLEKINAVSDLYRSLGGGIQ